MIKLDKTTWVEFNISKIFHFERGKRLIKADQVIGNIAYISSTKNNNGIDNYITPPNYMTVYENAITLNNSGSVGYCFYHSYKFVASDHCTVIKIKDNKVRMNNYIALFLIPIIESMQNKYNFAREINNNRLSKETIKLPSIDNKNPNWRFMEDYIKEMSNTITYNNKNIVVNYEKETLNTNKWKEFYIGGLNGIFNIEKGQEIISELKKGTIPLVSATKYNNGYIGKFELFNKLFHKNKITIASNGTIGKTFFQQNNFIATSDINVLSLNNMKLNIFIALFISVIIEKEMFRFEYGRKWGKDRMEKSKIKLPVDENGNPDWKFMEDYIKSLPYSSNL